MQFIELDDYVYNYIKDKLDNKDNSVKQDIYKILFKHHIDYFDAYSREMLSLALKKRMTIVIENYMLKENNSFYNKENYENFLCGYIDLFLSEFYQPIEIKKYNEINRDYNLQLSIASTKLENKAILLLDGSVIIVDDLKVAIEKILENKKIDSYKLKEIKLRIKRVVALSMLISGLFIISLSQDNNSLEQSEVVCETLTK